MEDTAVDIAAQVQTGTLTARQAVERSMQAIEDRDGPLQAFQEVRVFAALREADEIDTRADLPGSPQDGLPLSVQLVSRPGLTVPGFGPGPTVWS